MLLELAIGDAYGAGFEYASEDFVMANNNQQNLGHGNLKYVKHPKFDLQPGSYTDDTQMSIAIAEFLIETASKQQECHSLTIADKFVEVFKRDPRQGYSKRLYALLDEVTNGSEFLDKINNNASNSGAAMRAAPIGVLPDVAQVCRYAAFQAGITHCAMTGTQSAVAAALMSHYFISGAGSKSDLREFVLDMVIEPPEEWRNPWHNPVGSQGYMAIAAALTAIEESAGLSALLQRCVSFTGDTDTVCAIAMGAASNCAEIEKNIPQNLIDGLENGTYGRDYMIELDKKLTELIVR